MLVYLRRWVVVGFSLPVTKFVAGVVAGFGSCCSGHVKRRQNSHIVVKVAGRDCLLSPILVRHRVAPVRRSIQTAPLSSR